MSSARQRKWIVRDSEGRVSGPYSTRALLQKITEGNVGETHSVARYPSGEWEPISKNPEFYDHILMSLEKEVGVEPEEDEHEAEERTPIDPTRPGRVYRDAGPLGEDDFVMGGGALPDDTSQAGTNAKGANENLSRIVDEDSIRDDSNILDLDDKSELVKASVVKRFWKPTLVIGFLISAATVFLLWPTTPKGRVHLRAPGKKRVAIEDAKFRKEFIRAKAAFLRDTFRGYWEAQNRLITLVASRPKTLAARSLLCATYRELWFYSYQDRRDTKVFSDMVMGTRRIDPNGKHGVICEGAFSLAQGQFQKAQNLVEQALPMNVRESMFYEMRAAVWEHQKKYNLAIDYLRTIQNIEPKWIKPYRLQAQFLTKTRRYAEALKVLQGLLKRSPNHDVGNIEIGVLYHAFLGKDERALRHILLGFEKGQQIPPIVQVRGYKTLAKIYLKEGNKKKALENFKAAYRFNPNDSYVKKQLKRLGAKQVLKNKRKSKNDDLMALAEHYERQGDCFSAQAEYGAVFEGDPKNARAAFKAASCLWKLSQAKEAINWLDKALKADPRYIEAYVKKAEFYTERYDFREALRVLKRAVKISPKSHLVYRGFAILELKRNDFAAAIQYARKAVKIYQSDIESLILLVKAYLGKQEYQKAYEKAVQLRSLDSANPKVQEVYIRSLAAIQNLESAMAVVRGLIESYPYTIEYRFLYGQLLREDERYSTAEGVLRQVVQIDERYKPALLELGQVLQAQGKFNEARDLLLKAASEDPSDPKGLFLLGKLYLQAGNPKAALIQFQRVLKNNPLYPNAHYHSGEAALNARKFQKALQEAQKESQLNPNRADPYILQGDIYFFLRDYANCISAYQRAIKLRQPTSNLYVKQARCYRLQGGLHTALQLLRTAELKEPGNPLVWKEMGAVCEMKENINCAIEAYRQYLTLAPNAPDRAVIESRVARLITR